jgi:hypothetical protein
MMHAGLSDSSSRHLSLDDLGIDVEIIPQIQLHSGLQTGDTLVLSALL